MVAAAVDGVQAVVITVITAVPVVVVIIIVIIIVIIVAVVGIVKTVAVRRGGVRITAFAVPGGRMLVLAAAHAFVAGHADGAFAAACAGCTAGASQVWLWRRGGHRTGPAVQALSVGVGA